MDYGELRKGRAVGSLKDAGYPPYTVWIFEKKNPLPTD